MGRTFAAALLSLLSLLLFSGPAGPTLCKAQEEDEDPPGSADGEDTDELEEEPVTDPPSADENHPTDHKHWKECVEKAEAVESELGLFDRDDGEEKTSAKAKKMAEHAETITGKKSDYFNVFHAHMKDTLAKSGGMGAQDVCVHLVKHHDEL
eukprot:TRINITY_DN82619_c0_g1_i1.p1 TRINITY_DN82619_c0_g1~~TRINITY_DN82619_c0_g1_i1.p1  ORF type:complete len:152 (-),score=51.40 TRINITY_DN82619_c0_g1_i1:84-539(-)